MKRVEFKNAYYVKLGRKGQWEQSSIQEGKIRFGWSMVAIQDFSNGGSVDLLDRRRSQWDALPPGGQREIRPRVAFLRTRLTTSKPNPLTLKLWQELIAHQPILSFPKGRFPPQKPVGRQYQCDVMVPAHPGSAFEMVDPQIGLQPLEMFDGAL